MTLETLQKEMISAMKSKNKLRKDTISALIQAVKKYGIDNGCKDNMTEEMISTVLLKEQKTMQEMIDTCPADRIETLSEYNQKMEVIKEFAPQLITDPAEVETFINSLGIEITKQNRGQLMKALKGKVDMKVANMIISKRLK